MRKIYIITMHKCASTLQRRVFKSIGITSRYKFKDYAGEMWNNPKLVEEYANDYISYFQQDIQFQKPGAYILGPFRNEFLLTRNRGDALIIMLRNPKATVVSEYVSFAFTHQVPIPRLAKEQFLHQRKSILDLDVDSYALKRLKDFESYYKWIEDNLKKEDLILPFSDLTSRYGMALQKILLFLNLPAWYSFVVRIGVFIAEKKAKNFKSHTTSRVSKYANITLSDDVINSYDRTLAKYEYLWRR